MGLTGKCRGILVSRGLAVRRPDLTPAPHFASYRTFGNSLNPQEPQLPYLDTEMTAPASGED